MVRKYLGKLSCYIHKVEVILRNPLITERFYTAEITPNSAGILLECLGYMYVAKPYDFY